MNNVVSLIEHISNDQYLQIILSPYDYDSKRLHYDSKRLQNCLELLYLGSQFCLIYLALRGSHNKANEETQLNESTATSVGSAAFQFFIIIIKFCKIENFFEKKNTATYQQHFNASAIL